MFPFNMVGVLVRQMRDRGDVYTPKNDHVRVYQEGNFCASQAERPQRCQSYPNC